MSDSRPRQLAADVVILGSGPGGMAAVAAAAAEGAEVVAVEALEHIGGNSVWSTGYLAFVNSAMQAEQGITDDEDVFVRDAARDQFGVEWDEALVRLFARESAQTYRILTERGVRFSRFIPRPRQHTVDRMAAVEDSWMLGRASETNSSSLSTMPCSCCMSESTKARYPVDQTELPPMCSIASTATTSAPSAAAAATAAMPPGPVPSTTTSASILCTGSATMPPFAIRCSDPSR